MGNYETQINTHQGNQGTPWVLYCKVILFVCVSFKNKNNYSVMIFSELTIDAL